MEPYLNFTMALMQGNDPTPELEAIRQLPLEKRHVWRVASALKWAFADFDDLNVSADKETLAPEDFSKVSSAFFLKALVGAEEMQRMVIEAIGVAKKQE